jgi:hypothetical protein
MLSGELQTQLTALYRDFLSLRLHATWEEVVVPQISRWARKKDVDTAAYAKAKKRATSKR